MNKLQSVKSCYILLLLCLIVIYFPNKSHSQNENQTDYIPVTFKSEGSTLYGRFFKAATNESAQTVILLHGFPGGEGDLFGFGSRFREDGINALVFNFRGSWKSEGIFLLDNSLKDVITSINFLKSSDISKRFSIDTTQIILLGYSVGSSMAILGSLSNPSVKKIISVATTDFSVLAEMIERSDDYRKKHLTTLDEVMADTNVIRSIGGKATHEYLIAHKDYFSLVKHSKELASKRILFLGGWNDHLTEVEDHTIPFYRALQKNNAQNVNILVYDTDHFFTDFREQLYQDVLKWIRK